MIGLYISLFYYAVMISRLRYFWHWISQKQHKIEP